MIDVQEGTSNLTENILYENSGSKLIIKCTGREEWPHLAMTVTKGVQQ